MEEEEAGRRRARIEAALRLGAFRGGDEDRVGRRSPSEGDRSGDLDLRLPDYVLEFIQCWLPMETAVQLHWTLELATLKQTKKSDILF